MQGMLHIIAGLEKYDSKTIKKQKNSNIFLDWAQESIILILNT